jgi:hypothetical protein
MNLTDTKIREIKKMVELEYPNDPALEKLLLRKLNKRG